MPLALAGGLSWDIVDAFSGHNRQQATTVGLMRSVRRDEELFAEGAKAKHFYRVVSGTVRMARFLNDGRRQIDAFYLAGDFFGLANSTNYQFVAEAVDAAIVLSFRRSSIANLLRGNPVLGHQLMLSMMSSLDRAHEHMVLLGRKNAQQKMATFLLDMGCRLGHTEKAPDHLALPMPREDIADYLGLTNETVSRTFTQLIRRGLIKFVNTNRTIALSDKDGLVQLSHA